MRSFLRFLKPMVFLRRKAILSGVFGGSRKWLVWGGLAWVFHWIGRIFGVSEPAPRYTREVTAGERIVVVHEPLSPAGKKKAARQARRKARKAS